MSVVIAADLVGVMLAVQRWLFIWLVGVIVKEGRVALKEMKEKRLLKRCVRCSLCLQVVGAFFNVYNFQNVFVTKK